VAQELQLSAILCSRLCHDLVGPVSAIGNGLEFLDDGDAEMRAQAQELLAHSAEQAANRLNFFRIVFGRAGAGQISPAEAAKAAAAFLGDKKIALEWTNPAGEDAAPVERKSVRLLTNLVVLVSDALVRGGTIAVNTEMDATGLTASVRGEGPMVELDAPLREAYELANGGDPLSALSRVEPRTVQAFLVPIIAADIGAGLTLSEAGTQPIEAAARIPAGG
jgi:histidine phosphotransferase ChpT